MSLKEKAALMYGLPAGGAADADDETAEEEDSDELGHVDSAKGLMFTGNATRLARPFADGSGSPGGCMTTPSKANSTPSSQPASNTPARRPRTVGRAVKSPSTWLPARSPAQMKHDPMSWRGRWRVPQEHVEVAVDGDDEEHEEGDDEELIASEKEARVVASSVAEDAVEMAVTGRIPRSSQHSPLTTLTRAQLDLNATAWSDAWTAATDVVASVRQDMQDAVNRLQSVQQALEIGH